MKTIAILRCPTCDKVFVRIRNATCLIMASKMSFCSRECIGKFGFSTASEEDKQKAIESNVIEVIKIRGSSMAEYSVVTR